jgi:1-acyl-sn-glycerol-3-phosphate acyltransferase
MRGRALPIRALLRRVLVVEGALTMLDLALYDSLRLSRKPFVQRVVGHGLLQLDYRKVRIEFEGLERVPRRPVIYAMNHTDNYNYWPLQWELYLRATRYTCAWVKGKNFEHPFVSTFMRLTNNIPVASRGYLITRDFTGVMKRRPTEDEYRALRNAVEEGAPIGDGVPRKLLEQGRDMFGRRFDPRRESYADAVDGLFRQMMGRFLDLNRSALSDLDLDVIVFPQGTRSIRLSRGHIGIAQAVLALGATVVPVGCNGCDLVYPGGSPFTKPGKIVYRFGEAFEPHEWASLAPAKLEPFARGWEREHRAKLQSITDRIMDRINGLLDERHRFADDLVSDGTRGTDRFL